MAEGAPLLKCRHANEGVVCDVREGGISHWSCHNVIDPLLRHGLVTEQRVSVSKRSVCNGGGRLTVVSRVLDSVNYFKFERNISGTECIC